MTPLMIDVIIIVLAFGLLASGWHHGFVRTLGSLIGLVASIVVAIYGATWIETTFGFSFLSHPLSGIVLFLTLALIVSQIVGWLINLLDLVRRLLSIIPFVGLLNSLGGAVVGLAQAAAMIVAMAFIAVEFLPESTLRSAVLESQSVSTAVDVLYQVGLL